MTGGLSSVLPRSQDLKDRNSVRQWCLGGAAAGGRPTSDEVRSQFTLSQVIGSDVTVNRTRHYVRGTDMDGLDGVFGFFQRLDGLAALSS
jgi:hypothetical protein